MIISETIKLNDKNYTKVYSDAGFYIERNGVFYVEAVDPLGSGREYVETTMLIETEPESTEDKLKRISAKTDKNAADIEYLAMMTDTNLEG